MNYNIYRNLVLAKTTGANIHRINGLLGYVMHSLNCPENIPMSIKAMEEIGTITGVRYDRHQIKK